MRFNGAFDQLRSKFAGICNGGRAADELRRGTIKSRDAREAAQHVGQVAAENAAISVQFVEHDVAKIFEQAHPFGVVRQDAGVQHVRIGENHVGAFADGFARVAGRVAVIGEYAEGIVKARGEIVKFRELILRQGLGGKKIEGARIRIFENGIEYWQVVAKRLAGGSGSDDHEVFSAARKLGSRGLM